MNKMLKKKYHENMLFNRAAKLINNCKNYPFNSYYRYCENQSKYDIWDYKEISSPMKLFLEDISPDGTLYGISYSLKRYSNFSKELNMYFEHGLYFGNLVRDTSINSIYHGTITFSGYREHFIKNKSNKRVIKIGPYIHYADDYYNKEKMGELKLKFGKTLLFFPPHSIKDQDASYDIDLICQRLKRYQNDYDTIMVCLYYKDVINGLGDYFERNGFIVVSAGHFYDFNFLRRLKSIIKLADHSISMAIGTHIGYCIYLRTPHEIINEKCDEMVPGKNNRLFNIIREKDVDNRGDGYIESFEEAENEILNYFYNCGSTISEKQKNVCNKYWGFEEIKQPVELLEIFKSDK